MKKVTELEVNNGRGLYDSDGLIDTLISDCNNAVKSCVGGQYIAFCNIMVQMVQKLAKLKIGIRNDIQNRENNIRFLEKQLSDLGHPIDKIDANDLLKSGSEDGEN